MPGAAFPNLSAAPLRRESFIAVDGRSHTTSGGLVTATGRNHQERLNPTGRRVRGWILASTTVVVLAGCSALGPTYVYVDSIAARDTGDLTDYYLLSELRRRSRVAGRELDSAYARKRDAKFIELTDKALQSAGFRPVDSPDEAQLVILLNYAIDVSPRGLNKERTSTVQIVAFDWAAVRDMDQRNAVWRTSAWMEGGSGGLGRVVPILIEAAGPYLGTSTRGTVEVTVR